MLFLVAAGLVLSDSAFGNRHPSKVAHYRSKDAEEDIDQYDYQREAIKEEAHIEKPLWEAEARLKKKLLGFKHPSSFLEEGKEFPHSDLTKERKAALRQAFDAAAKDIHVQQPTGWLAAAGFPADKGEKQTLTDLDTAEFDYSQVRDTMNAEEQKAKEDFSKFEAENKQEQAEAKKFSDEWNAHHNPEDIKDAEVADISGPPSSFLESNSDDDNFVARARATVAAAHERLASDEAERAAQAESALARQMLARPVQSGAPHGSSFVESSGPPKREEPPAVRAALAKLDKAQKDLEKEREHTEEQAGTSTIADLPLSEHSSAVEKAIENAKRVKAKLIGSPPVTGSLLETFAAASDAGGKNLRKLLARLRDSGGLERAVEAAHTLAAEKKAATGSLLETNAAESGGMTLEELLKDEHDAAGSPTGKYEANLGALRKKLEKHQEEWLAKAKKMQEDAKATVPSSLAEVKSPHHAEDLEQQKIDAEEQRETEELHNPTHDYVQEYKDLTEGPVKDLESIAAKYGAEARRTKKWLHERTAEQLGGSSTSFAETGHARAAHASGREQKYGEMDFANAAQAMLHDKGVVKNIFQTVLGTLTGKDPASFAETGASSPGEHETGEPSSVLEQPDVWSNPMGVFKNMGKQDVAEILKSPAVWSMAESMLQHPDVVKHFSDMIDQTHAAEGPLRLPHHSANSFVEKTASGKAEEADPDGDAGDGASASQALLDAADSGDGSAGAALVNSLQSTDAVNAIFSNPKMLKLNVEELLQDPHIWSEAQDAMANPKTRGVLEKFMERPDVEGRVGELAKDPKIRKELEGEAEKKDSPLWKMRTELATDLADGQLSVDQNLLQDGADSKMDGLMKEHPLPEGLKHKLEEEGIPGLSFLEISSREVEDGDEDDFEKGEGKVADAQQKLRALHAKLEAEAERAREEAERDKAKVPGSFAETEPQDDDDRPVRAPHIKGMPRLDFTKLEAARSKIGRMELGMKREAADYFREQDVALRDYHRRHGRREPTSFAEVGGTAPETGDALQQVEDKLEKIRSGMKPQNREYQKSELVTTSDAAILNGTADHHVPSSFLERGAAAISPEQLRIQNRYDSDVKKFRAIGDNFDELATAEKAKIAKLSPSSFLETQPSAAAKLHAFAEEEQKAAAAAAKDDLAAKTASDKAALAAPPIDPEDVDDSKGDAAAASLLETADRSKAYSSIPEFRAAMARNEERFREQMQQNLYQFGRAMDQPSLLQTGDRSGLQLKK